MQYNEFRIDQFIVLKLQFQGLKHHDYGEYDYGLILKLHNIGH